MFSGLRGGKDGWFKLKSIEYVPGEITGSISVNPLNNPKFRLDRYTGMLSISGKSGDFVAKCHKFDPRETERAF